MEPIRKPVVNSQLEALNTLQRTTESFRYAALSIERWISPEGQIREWVKANARLAVLLAVPTFMAFPVVTVALWELESWINTLTAITSKLIVLPVLVLLAFISIAIFFKIISVFKR